MGETTQGTAALHYGDCLEVMQKLPERSVDLVLCDLPYGITACQWDEQLDPSRLWEAYDRLVKPNGVIALFATQPFSSAIGSSKLEWLRYSWTWVKNRPTNHMNAKRQPMRATEEILIFYRHQPTYNPQGLLPFNKTVVNSYRDEATSAENPTSVLSGHIKTHRRFQEVTNYPHNVICFDAVRNGSHPTEKPVDLLRYMIRTYTNPGDTVLDSCMGSGSTGEAAVSEQRAFVGIERDPAYFAAAFVRIENYKYTLDACNKVAI